MNSFKNQTIIIPFDFSEPSKLTLDQVIEWSDPTTRIHMIFVVVPTLTFISMDPAIQMPPNFDIESCDRANKEMAKEYSQGKYAAIKHHCVIGDPGIEIVDLADSVRANFIIMPSHGRTGISRLLLGSVAERVLRLASCPVLIMRGESIEPRDEATAAAVAGESGN